MLIRISELHDDHEFPWGSYRAALRTHRPVCVQEGPEVTDELEVFTIPHGANILLGESCL
jgi:hypothetical protein